MLSIEKINELKYSTTMANCKGCTNSCRLTINRFSGGRQYISGNRCERGIGKQKNKENIPNLFDYKYKKIFGYTPLDADQAVRGKVGIPRVLNMFENYPFWFTFFTKLGYRVVLSDPSTKKTYEAGIELTGTEVRSLRENNCQLTDCFALIRNGEVWLNNVHISPYSNGSIFNPDPDRRRKLLLHKKQIRYLDAKVAEKGLAIVPLKMYFNEDGRVKVELALARGKKLYDKRQDIAKKDMRREAERDFKVKNLY